MKIREEERIYREKEILKEISGVANQTNMVDNDILKKYLVKFVRKMLTLTMVDPYQSKLAKKQFLVQKYPSYLHLAQIMEERIDSEKDTFGKVVLSNMDQDQSH